MSNYEEKAMRLIARERVLTAGGGSPPPRTIEKTIEFINSNHLFGNSLVRAYLVESAAKKPNNYLISTKLAEAVRWMIQADHAADSLEVYKNIVYLKEPEIWYGNNLGAANILSKTLFSELFVEPGFVLDHLQTWGTTLVELLDALLLSAQKKQWATDSSKIGATSETPHKPLSEQNPFLPRYDDSIANYEFVSNRYAPHRLLAASLGKALLVATTRAEPTGFASLANQLLAIKWSLAALLPLQALYDSLRETGTRTWQVAEAARLLSLQSIEAMSSLTTWRRLLRTAMHGSIPEELRAPIVENVRANAPNESVKLLELSDVRDWSDLTAAEQRSIAEYQSKYLLSSAIDPRERPKIVSSSWSAMDSSLTRLWSIQDQQPLIALLDSWRPERNKDWPDEERKAELFPRLDALDQLLNQDAASEIAWRWHFVYWAEKCLVQLRHHLAHRGKDLQATLSRVDYLEMLTRHFPRWQIVAGWALEGIQTPILDEHVNANTSTRAWGATDPIFVSLTFLDELLAIEDGEPFDQFRAEFGIALAKVWPNWPRYTRSVALVIVRDYYWHRLAQLSAHIDELWTNETDPNLLIRCMDFVLARRGVAANLRTLVERLAAIQTADELVARIGEVVGDGLLRWRGDKEALSELEPVAALGDDVMVNPTVLGKHVVAFIRGLTWGALHRIQSTASLTQRHADHWTPLAVRALELAQQFCSAEDRLEGILQAITSVLESTWPNDIRANLYDRLVEPFEKVLRSAELGDFSWLHYLLCRELEGKIDANQSDGGYTPQKHVPLAARDEVLVRLCRASAERVLEWSRMGATTNDGGWWTSLVGQDTAEMIRLVYSRGRDRAFLQRSLPAVVDLLHGAGRIELSTELRLMLRRGA